MAVSVQEHAKEYPPFQLGKPRFDQGTFWGRYRHFLDVIDPRTLFTTKEQLASAIKLLDDYKNGTLEDGITDKQLWEAQKTKQAIIHPDTGNKIFMPFRMSGYVPFGTPTVVGLLLPNQTFGTTIFWQWLNQSHNACVNFSNRNATKETPLHRFVLGYVGAVSSACGIAVGLNVFINRAKSFSPTSRMVIQRFVPFPAVALANICNVSLMRYSELWDGIEVMNTKGNVIGTSKVAAKYALVSTAMTRVVLPAPILLIPPVIFAFVENKTNFLKKFPRMHFPFQVFVCTAAFAFALPIAISLFPQMATMKVSQMEPEIQEATNEDIVVFNKGL